MVKVHVYPINSRSYLAVGYQMDIFSEFVHKDYNSSVAFSGFGQSRRVVSRATASRFLHLAAWTVSDIGSNLSIQVAPSKVPLNIVCGLSNTHITSTRRIMKLSVFAA